METLPDPFSDDIVSEPRRIEKSVTGLNDKLLNNLIQQFEKLTETPVPRRRKLTHAQFVVSSQAGYGKSHLIGRLFHKLNCKGTLVYLRPFEDVSTCWKSILLKMVQELDFPDNAKLEYGGENNPTQFETFAHGILLHLIVSFIRSDDYVLDNKEKIIEALRRNIRTPATFRNRKELPAWIRKNIDGLTGEFIRQIRYNGIHLNASPSSWLNGLITHTFSSELVRENCRDWLRGGSIEPEEAKQIGIRRTDVPEPEMPGSERNELCKDRISDLCQLAGFFRPFVFCFDQTENYAKETTLSKVLGSVIQVLTDECPNHMTVITVKQETWENGIRPWWDEAHRNRLSPPLELEGLDKEQATELIDHRFDGLGLEAEKTLFLDNDQGLEQLFQSMGDTPGRRKGDIRKLSKLGIREFLRRCANRWQMITGTPVIEKPPLSDYYKKAVEEIKTRPKRLVFDLSIFQWLVHEAAEGLPHIEAEKYKSPKGYFTRLWKSGDRKILFGFEEGGNWRRWEAIHREAKIHYDAYSKTKAVLFRTPEQPVIPGAKWKIAPVMDQAKKRYFHIMQLEKPELAELYAAHDLHVDAGEGNIPFQRHEVLEFIRQELAPFWERIKQPLMIDPEQGPEAEPKPGPELEKLSKEIQRIVRNEKLMGLKDLKTKLSQPVAEEMISEALDHIPEIKVYAGPKESTLQWQSNKSM